MVSHVPTDAMASTAACALCGNLFPASHGLCEHVATFALCLQGNRCQLSADGISSKNAVSVAELRTSNSELQRLSQG